VNPHRAWWLSRWAGLWPVGATLLAGLLTWLAFPPEQVARVMSEEGPVERLTAATYLGCAIALWVWRDRDAPSATGAALATMMLAFSARELDWHKAFTGTSVLKLSWYAGPASVSAKAVALAVLVPVLLAGWYLLRRHARRVWRGWQQGEAMPSTVVLFLATLVVAKVIDRSVGILQDDHGVMVPVTLVALRSAVEEWLELALTLLVLLGLVQHRARRNA
jgi:hypothetical protein